MDLSIAESAIRNFLIDDLLYDRNLKKLSADDPLLSEGLLDSLAILKTVAFCEETFGISIPDEEVLPDHFETIRAIGQLVERLMASPSGHLSGR